MSADPERMRALIAFARMELDPDPATWPLDKLGGEGFAAAAVATDRVDLLPEHLAEPATVWKGLGEPFRNLVKQRNPAMAAYCAHAARENRA